ncbi:TnsA endonuclease N-terminal domain-containing protein [Shewanella sp. AC91-MNA-CIBAN-0169]|uniref:TnsA endonuclease N-terminal domain-containing protein n=1 Tax=Shewanella sp. AC91-MNA-CIBAN-0169 TaxID=3140466 RepID=UPI003327CAFB
MKERSLPRYSKILPRIQFYSIKNDSTRYCDSELEAARLLLLEFDDEVKVYNTQPSSFSYKSYGKKLRYTPDIIIGHKQKGVYFEEVKVFDKLNSPKNIDKFKILQTLFNKICEGGLSTITEKDIHDGDKIANLKKLYHYKSLALSKQCKLLMSQLPSTLTYSELIDWAELNQCHLYDPMILLANYYYSFDLTHLLNAKTILDISDGTICI